MQPICPCLCKYTADPLWLRQVRSAVSLSREASGRQLVEAVPGEEALALQEANSGVVRLRAGDPFSEEMSALWLGVQSLGFTLVCEPHENLLLAEGTLRNLTRHCLEHLHMLGQGSEVRAPPNRQVFIFKAARRRFLINPPKQSCLTFLALAFWQP